MLYRTLGRTGLKVSVLSLGASPFGGVFHPVMIEDCVKTVEVALEGGVNYFDTSPAYGNTVSEKNLGIALRGVPRGKYFLATKVGSYGDDIYDFSAGSVERSIHESLARLGVDYVDVIQCHDIEFADLKQVLCETLPALERLKVQKLVRHIGITGLPLGIFTGILDHAPEGLVETVLSFCRYALNDTALEKFFPYFREKGVGIINASCTGMSLLNRRGPPEWHPAGTAIRVGCRKAVEFCDARGVDIVKLAVQFSCAQEEIATTLVGTASPKNLRDNLAYLAETPDWKLINDVREVLKPVMNFNYTRGRSENHEAIIG